MDANGLRFWMLADEADWSVDAGADVDSASGRLRLRSARGVGLHPNVNGTGAEAEARVALGKVPQARDAFGTRAYWDADEGVIATAGSLPGAVVVWEAPAGTAPDDLAVGLDGVLYVVVDGRVVLHDLRGRWSDVTVEATAFTAWRIAPDPAGGCWVLDRDRQALGHVHGLPLPDRPYAPHTPCTARPCAENPDPPELVPLPGASWTGEAVALACGTDGRLALLLWRAGEDAVLLTQGPGGALESELHLGGVHFPHTIAWVSTSSIATRVVRVPGEALVFDLEDALAADAQSPLRNVEAVGDAYLLRDAVGGSFVHSPGPPAFYPTVDGAAPLLPVSAPSFSSAGAADGVPLDSGANSTVWHRLYTEAVLPAGTGARFWLAATNQAAAPTAPEEWHEHRLGTVPRDVSGVGPGSGLPVPRAAWVSVPSEIPFHKGRLGCDPEPGRKGLFTALIQRSNRRVRTLQGRYLWIRAELLGDRRSTPEIAAVRAYGSRFSYVERYLPRLYHERTFGSERDDVTRPGETDSRATAADFLERFLGNAEGVLTILEDRIGAAHLLTDPETVPEESLEWLASWIGVAFEPSLSPSRRRQVLKAAPYLFRHRGTLNGLRTALGIATGGSFQNGRVVGGAIEGGEIVILENWKLRRTFATILGADLADEEDPLLSGLAASGNSFVGDTLILGDENRREFLALFGAGLPMSPAEEAAVRAFFDGLAFRVTVLVHQEVDPQDLGLIRRIVDLEKPAHVEALVATARYPFMVGVAALVGIDSYLRPPAPAQAVAVGESLLGEDFLLGPASLDPRLAASTAVLLGETGPVPPQAVLRAPDLVNIGVSFDLDGSRSTAAPGHELTRFSWGLLR